MPRSVPNERFRPDQFPEDKTRAVQFVSLDRGSFAETEHIEFLHPRMGR